jgi:hypothetical protein
MGLYAALGFRSFGCERRALKIGERYVDEEHMVMDLKSGGAVTDSQRSRRPGYLRGVAHDVNTPLPVRNSILWSYGR